MIVLFKNKRLKSFHIILYKKIIRFFLLSLHFLKFSLLATICVANKVKQMTSFSLELYNKSCFFLEILYQLLSFIPLSLSSKDRPMTAICLSAWKVQCLCHILSPLTILSQYMAQRQNCILSSEPYMYHTIFMNDMS